MFKWKSQEESHLFVRLLRTNIFKVMMPVLQIAKIIPGISYHHNFNLKARCPNSIPILSFSYHISLDPLSNIFLNIPN